MLILRVSGVSSKFSAWPQPNVIKREEFSSRLLGGHLKHNGELGWITLGRGFDKLLMMELGWMAAMRAIEERSL